MDWESLREWLSALGMLAIGGGTLWLAYTGQAFRKDKQFHYKFELAKEAIRIFNHLRNDIMQIRSPAGYEGELNELKNLPEDKQLIVGMKTAGSRGGLTLLRMNKRGESLAEMNRLEPEFRSVFGDVPAFDEMRKVHREIVAACHILTNSQLGTSKESLKYDQVIWAIKPDDDINTRMNAAITEIEQICHPVLSNEKNGTDNKNVSRPATG